MFKNATKAHTSLPERKRRFHDFLKENPVGVLSTITPDGEPHGVVIYFNVNNDLSVSFLTRADTKKHDNLKHNNHVALTVFEAKSQAVVQLSGIANLVQDSYEVNGIAGAILGSSIKTGAVDLPPVSKMDAGAFVGYEIIPIQARMAVYSHKEVGDNTGYFESIESFDLNEHNDYTC